MLTRWHLAGSLSERVLLFPTTNERQARLDAVRTALLSPMPEAMHTLPYARYTNTDRAAFLMRCGNVAEGQPLVGTCPLSSVFTLTLADTPSLHSLSRQYVHLTLHDRIVTRPFLSLCEKKWLTFQVSVRQLRLIECSSQPPLSSRRPLTTVMVTLRLSADSASAGAVPRPRRLPRRHQVRHTSPFHCRLNTAPEHCLESSRPGSQCVRLLRLCATRS